MSNSALLRASLKTLASTVGIAGAAFVTSMLTARQLGPDGRGALAAYVLVASLSAASSQLGFANAYIYRRRTDPNSAYQAMALAGLIAIALAAPVLAWGIGRFTGFVAFNGHLPLLLTMAGATALLLYVNTLSQSESGLGSYNLGRALVPICLLVFAVSVQLLGAPIGFVQYVAVQTGLTLLAIGVLAPGILRMIRQAKGTTSPGNLRGFFDYAAKFHANALVGIVVMNIDKLFLLQKVSPREFGFYALSFTTTRLLGTVQDSVSTAIFARHAGRDEAALSQSVRRAFRLTFLPMLAVAAGLAAVSGWLIPLIFGAPFRPMVLPFSILAFEAVIGAASWTLTQRLVGGGRPGVMLARSLSLLLVFLLVFHLLPDASLITYLAWLMLALAVLRLALAMAIFPWVLKEPLPTPWPRSEDWLFVRQLVARKAVRR